MIQQDEHIIYISQAKCAVTIKELESMKTGMLEKKIVITTRRCLFFQSLSNQVLEIQYEIMTKKKKKQDQNKDKKQPKKRISINQFPQHSFPINDRECKIMIDEEPTCHKYLVKIGLRNFLKSISGIVILKNMPKMKFQLLAFPSLKDGFRFCKAVVCSKAWTVYQKYCNQNKLKTNKLWSRILSEIANNQKSVVLIDPQLFITGSNQQIKSFLVLVDQIPFAHSFEHRYSITSNQISQYATQFLQIFQQKSHSLIFRQNNMNTLYMNTVFAPRLKLEHLMSIDLSKNKLTDDVFAILQRLAKQCKKLSFYNLSYNAINFHNSTLFINFLKATQVILTINLSNNQIDDICIDSIQKFVIMPQNPPIEEINLSFNKLTPKGAWRLFVGNNRYKKYHSYMQFIVYPIPIKLDTFPQNPIEYPRPGNLMNFNIHSALVQQFQQQSFMKHTLHQVLLNEGSTIRLIRKLPPGIKLPKTKQQVYKATQFANKIQNFMYSHQFVENMYDIAEEIANFEFNLSPVTKQRFIKYLSDKLNQALFIRDHYSVKYILKAFRKLGVDYQGYQPRIDKLMMRDDIMNKKIEGIINFEVDQFGINRQLDEIVRQGLRLYLGGNGIESAYYLKYLRDRWIERLIKQKYNPEHFIYEKMADKNMNMQDQVTQKQLVIPYQIRVEKKINENFYLHPWKANYYSLSFVLKQQFDECLQFLQQSSKKQKFAIYFQRIQDRIEFIKSQFALFNYNKFKLSYSDLKVNCSRLYSMYRYIQSKQFYLQIPPIARKVPVSKEKIVTIQNQVRFKDEYHISKYPNINKKARNARYFNYTNKMTRYGTQEFNQQYLKIKPLMDSLFKTLQKQASSSVNKIAEECIRKIVQIIKRIRQATYPNQLKEEFYLRVISWRDGRHMNNRQILQFLPFLTMYLRPPLALEKYIIAAILSCQNLNIGQLPLCLVSDINKTTDINIQQLQKAYVQRDWMGSQKLLQQLMRSNGKVQISIQLLTKRSIELNIPQSRTVGDIVSRLTGMIKDIQDITHYWLYMGYVGDSQNLIVLQESQHIGQLLAQRQEVKKYFLLKRRIYCPQWKYMYQKYSENVINNLYYDFKYEYLIGEFFINTQQMINLASSMFLIDLAQEHASSPKSNLNQLLNQKVRNIGSIYKGYMPIQAINKFHKSPNDIVTMMRDKVNEKVMKKQHLKPLQIKKEILQQFEQFPEFFCSNYLFFDRNRKIIKLSINWFQIYVSTELQIQTLGLEKIISIIPMKSFLLVNYHKHQGITGKLSLFGEQNKILSTAHDILAYCMIRIKMLSPSLYSAYRYQSLTAKYIKVKEPTKDKQILDTIRRIKKNLSSANPTILDLQVDVIPYFGKNNYIKTPVMRKLYAEASLQKLEFVDDIDDEMEQMDNYRGKRSYNDDSKDLSTHNVFKTIFPKLKQREEEDYQPSQSLMKSYSQPPELSAYNNISASYIAEPQQRVNEPVKQPKYQQPPKSPTKYNMPPPSQTDPPNEQYEPPTTAQKPRNRFPTKVNR